MHTQKENSVGPETGRRQILKNCSWVWCKIKEYKLWQKNAPCSWLLWHKDHGKGIRSWERFYKDYEWVRKCLTLSQTSPDMLIILYNKTWVEQSHHCYEPRHSGYFCHCTLESVKSWCWWCKKLIFVAPPEGSSYIKPDTSKSKSTIK